MNINKTLTWLGGVALLAVSVNASALNVDLFSTSQDQLIDSTTGDGGLSSAVTTAGDDILGSERELTVELLTRDAAAPNSTADIGVAGGALSFSVDSLATGTGSVTWDGAADGGSTTVDTDGLGGINLPDAGVNVFAVTTLFSDLGYEFVVTAWTDDTHWTSISFSAHEVEAGSPVTSFIPFAAFQDSTLCNSVNPAPGVNSITCSDGAGAAGGTQVADFTNLGALQLVIDPNGGTTSVDLTLDSIVIPERVPEPSMLGLLGLGLLVGGLTSYRVRRKS